MTRSASQPPLQILDAGGGLGQMAIWLAQQGHQVVLAEPSAEMLAVAADNIRQAGLEHVITLQQASVQDLAMNADARYDLITFHAVLEWLAQPHRGLEELLTCLKPGGWLSLMFFDYHSTVMRRLIAGDLKPCARANCQQWQTGFGSDFAVKT